MDLLIDSIKEGITEGVASTQKAQDAADQVKGTARDKAFKFSPAESGGSVAMALTKDDIKFGFEVHLKTNSMIQFGKFGLGEVSLKLNSLDDSNEYWKFGGKIDFSHIMKGFGGFEASINSFYWCPDTIKVEADLEAGIPVGGVAYIDKVGLEVEGLSTIAYCKYQKTCPNGEL